MSDLEETNQRNRNETLQNKSIVYECITNVTRSTTRCTKCLKLNKEVIITGVKGLLLRLWVSLICRK